MLLVEKYKNKQLGTIGDIGIFSLHPRKNFHVFGDGGLIVTKNKRIYEKVKTFKKPWTSEIEMKHLFGEQIQD